MDTSIFDIFTLSNQKELTAFGVKIGHLYTDHGLPIDMALDKTNERYPDLGKTEMLAILEGVCEWLVEHKRLSGAPEKAIERQRATNRKMIADYLKTGETGAY